MSIDVMKQAIEALEEAVFYLGSEYTCVEKECEAAITALRAAIEQSEQRWVKSYAGGKPNYTTPEEQTRQWQGLTDEEITAIACTPAAIPGSYVASFARAIEAKLREKNNG